MTQQNINELVTYVFYDNKHPIGINKFEKQMDNSGLE